MQLCAEYSHPALLNNLFSHRHWDTAHNNVALQKYSNWIIEVAARDFDYSSVPPSLLEQTYLKEIKATGENATEREEKEESRVLLSTHLDFSKSPTAAPTATYEAKRSSFLRIWTTRNQ